MSKKITNENSNCENNLKLEDKDYLNILLEIEKNMSNNYSVAMNEASSDDLYENFFDMFTSIKDTSRDIFDLLNYLGWYKIEKVDDTKVNKMIEQLENQLNCLE